MKKLSSFIVILARKTLKRKILKERLDNAFDFMKVIFQITMAIVLKNDDKVTIKFRMKLIQKGFNIYIEKDQQAVLK